jgi:hypothetical protein
MQQAGKNSDLPPNRAVNSSYNAEIALHHNTHGGTCSEVHRRRDGL